MFKLLLPLISVLFSVPVIPRITEPLEQAEVKFSSSACILGNRPTLPIQADGALFWAV